MEEWHPPTTPRMPVGPQSFPPAGINSLATLGQRATARLLDSLLVGLAWLPIVFVVLIARTKGDPMAEVESTPLDYVLLMGPLIALAVVYDAVSVTFWGKTVGKLAVGIRVARQANGRSPLWWEAALRAGLPGVVAIVPAQGIAIPVAISLFVTAGFDPMRRNLVDRAAGTVVVRSR